MTNALKPVKATPPPVDWTYLMLMGLVALGIIILMGLVLEVPLWLFTHR